MPVQDKYRSWTSRPASWVCFFFIPRPFFCAILLFYFCAQDAMATLRASANAASRSLSLARSGSALARSRQPGRLSLAQCARSLTCMQGAARQPLVFLTIFKLQRLQHHRAPILTTGFLSWDGGSIFYSHLASFLLARRVIWATRAREERELHGV